MSDSDKNEEIKEQEAPVEEKETAQAPEKEEKTSFKDKKKNNAELKKAEARAEEAEKALGEYKDKYTRIAAEFDNYKKRTAKELDSRYADAKGDVWKNILPTVDNLERALKIEETEENKTYRQGVELVYKQLTEAMTAAGVKEIEAQGKEFNPEFHNAVMHVDDENFGENTVAEVFLKGYILGDKVHRTSMVKVAN